MHGSVVLDHMQVLLCCYDQGVPTATRESVPLNREAKERGESEVVEGDKTAKMTEEKKGRERE